MKRNRSIFTSGNAALSAVLAAAGASVMADTVTTTIHSASTASAASSSISGSSSGSHSVSTISITAPVSGVNAAVGSLTMILTQPVINTDAQGHLHVTQTTNPTSFVIDGKTKFRGIKSLQDIHIGDTLSVSGEQKPDGKIYAVTITDSSGHIHAGSSTMSVTSQVKNIDPANETFVVVILDPFQNTALPGNFPTGPLMKELTVVVDKQTEFSNLTGLTDIHIGDTISASGDKLPDGTLHASVVSR